LSDAAVPQNKKAIAQSFSRAAHTYDDVAQLQRYVGECLLQQALSCLDTLHDQVILDLGCGTGYLSQKLIDVDSNQHQVIGLDLAFGMVQFARQKMHEKPISFVCADAELLPLANNSVDLIISNFAIQWCPSKTALFADIYRALKPGGSFLFTLPGENTLWELKQSWQQVDPEHSHVNQFEDEEALNRLLQAAGLQLESLHSKTQTMHYQRLRDLTAELKALGAHNLTEGRTRQLTGKTKLKQLIAAYEGFRNDEGLLPATWDVIYGQCSKP